MKKIYSVTVVFICVLMMCCKKENVDYLSHFDWNDLAFKDTLKPVIEYRGVPFTENNFYSEPVRNAMKAFNRKFENWVQEVIDYEDTQGWIDETPEEWEAKQDAEGRYIEIRGAERDLDTVINHMRYRFTTEL